MALLLATGCYKSPSVVVTVGRADVWKRAPAGHLRPLVRHDPHLHHVHCGHYRRWHRERWVYYYDQRWEYFDAHRDSWFFFAQTRQ
jgi:hypothetical protein